MRVSIYELLEPITVSHEYIVVLAFARITIAKQRRQLTFNAIHVYHVEPHSKKKKGEKSRETSPKIHRKV